jgi:predicted MFS family arabinose efflux permease
MSTDAPALPTRASLVDVVRQQRKILLVGVVLMVASYWVLGQLGEWQTATLTAVGVLLAMINHLVTEYWLARIISSGEEPTRRKIGMSSFVRLMVLAAVAVGAAIAFWPYGIGLLLGLAIFRLIALVMTTIPLLKELKAQ